MPLVKSNYKKPFYLFNAHLETIVPSALRKVEGVEYKRRRLELPDGDFLDIDQLVHRKNNDKVLIISHGLEGSSERPYVRGMAKLFYENGFDICAWNCRSCSGEMNRLPRLYHHGDTDDLHAVIKDLQQIHGYSNVFLAGLSMGGAMSLKYAGEERIDKDEHLKGVMAFSVPTDLRGSSLELNKYGNGFYRKRFLNKLKNKIVQKRDQFSGILDIEKLEEVQNFQDFDANFTTKISGFDSVDEFYFNASCGNFLSGIKVPSLLVNAINDPILSQSCYPFEVAKNHEHLYLETPETGGHVGFLLHKQIYTWSELRALDFAKDIMNVV
ncbi:YheT family hydrolase [Marinigracilibium pacificum]|uniref:Alpha/beta fold hydrolase n=1 Tax=Marinigracilibium pacificum TaxID=2729599 RepID=A0A848IXQ0_9BACT|nr:alpha/beta fold hydrolase [Marinigracilibium pacificum]NMM47948.1 alpha/beta fold hydrolase [Marinigracilibium pacificum]